ncbi:MAG: transcription elongation factor GreA [Treponema sp.]|nr:transcription elongation factor GreA [Treponema sp.]
MSENLINTVQEKLKEETWTRATISNYTQNDLKDLAVLVEEAKKENCVDGILAITEEHLSHTKDSIIALYLSGMLSLEKGVLNNTALEALVDIFQKNHKENIVVYLCESILADDPNNKFALRTLAKNYQAEGDDKAWELYTTLIKIDLDEAPIAKSLAEHYEETGDTKNAIEYYKKALLRFIKAEKYNECKDVWSKLVQTTPDDIDFFQLARRKIVKAFSPEKTSILMQELYEVCKDQAPANPEKWDIAIEILKQNLEVEPKDTWARKEIVDCYRKKYASHSHLEDYIRNSNLTQSYRDVFEAISDFEKHIAFDTNNFVFHKTWGVGIIKELTKDSLKIRFSKKIGVKELSLKMAVIALKPLAKDHIWVMKATKSREELREMVKNQKEYTLEVIIKSFDNNCDFKRIKAELVPSILDLKEWPSWNTAAKKELEKNPKFAVNPNDSNMYTVRENGVSDEEKLANEFKAEKKFNERVNIILSYHEKGLDKSKEVFAEMYSYFTGYLKNTSKVTEQVISSYLLIQKLNVETGSQFEYQFKETFAELYNRIEDPRDIYSLIKKNPVLRNSFLDSIKMLPDWNVQYIRLFPIVLDMALIDELIEKGFEADVQKLVRTSFESFKDFRETVLFFFEHAQDKEWFQAAGVTYEKQLIALVNIIVVTFREINNHVNSTENKKINKNATELLFAEDALFAYMFSKDEDTVKKMYTIVDDIADLDSKYKAKIRHKILEKYPNFKFRVVEEKSTQPKGMYVTAKMLEQKKAEREHIQKVELPENAIEWKDAVAKGDLSENAEFDAAKRRKAELTARLTKLDEEIGRAVEFDPTTITNAVVSFATVVTLEKADSKEVVTYTVLGPWETNPDENIISYMSPLGNAMMDKKVGDKFSYSVDDVTYSYVIKGIEKANI